MSARGSPARPLGSRGVSASHPCQKRRSFSFKRLAAWRAEVVRWTSRRMGNHSPQCFLKQQEQGESILLNVLVFQLEDKKK